MRILYLNPYEIITEKSLCEDLFAPTRNLWISSVTNNIYVNFSGQAMSMPTWLVEFETCAQFKVKILTSLG